LVEISATMVKELRESTGAGVMDCKRALQVAEGNFAKATEILREQGAAKAEKRAERTALQGLVEAYIHAGGRIGAMVEVNCETDFVARTDDFKRLVHDIAMQIAATNPKVVGNEGNHDGDDGTSEIAKEDVLLTQPFIKDPSISIQDLVKSTIAKTGENIVVRRFSRFELGI
jgi:elongation factor Ts